MKLFDRLRSSNASTVQLPNKMDVLKREIAQLRSRAQQLERDRDSAKQKMEKTSASVSNSFFYNPHTPRDQAEWDQRHEAEDRLRLDIARSQAEAESARIAYETKHYDYTEACTLLQRKKGELVALERKVREVYEYIRCFDSLEDIDQNRTDAAA